VGIVPLERALQLAADVDLDLVEVAQHDAEGFGGCTNIGECTAACPKEIPLDVISRLNWDLHAAMRHGR
jgi:succinate dehydrogenase/fumarate reductase-like Fe-S protein